MAALLLIGVASRAFGDGPGTSTFDTRTANGFGDLRAGLAGYLAHVRPRAVGPQHFCVIGYEPADDPGVTRFALIHWREGRRLIRWLGTDPEFSADALRFAREIDLQHDVVATGAEIAGSTYLVTRAWVAAVIADCAAAGARYTIRPRR